MNTLIKIIVLIIVYTLAFPPLLTTSVVLFWSAFNPPEFLLGSAFFEFIGGCASGYFGVLAFTRVHQMAKHYKKLTTISQ